MSSASRSRAIASRSVCEHCEPISSVPGPAAAARPAPEGRQQRAVDDEVGIAPDRRGEVAVARAREPGVAEVRGRVVGLLERAQHERGQRGAAGRCGAGTRSRSPPISPTARRPVRRDVLRHRRRRHVEALELGHQARSRPGRAARGRGTSSACAGARAPAPPARWRGSSAARSPVCDSVWISSMARTTLPSSSNSKSGSAVSTAERAAREAALTQHRGELAGQRERLGDRPPGAFAPGEDARRPRRSRGARPSGSGCGRTRWPRTSASRSSTISTVTVRRGTPGTRLQASLEKRVRQHRLDGPRDVDAVAAPLGLGVERRPGTT